MAERKLKNVTSEHLQSFFDLLSFGGVHPDGKERKGYSKDYIHSFSAVKMCIRDRGYMLAVPGILIGSIMGTIISYCLQSKGWSVFAFIVSLCGACLFGILLVYISVRKPAKIAANTSPISALKNQVGIVNYRTHKRHRITPVYLAKISFFRNRKKSLLTILSLGPVSYTHLDVYKRQSLFYRFH